MPAHTTACQQRVEPLPKIDVLDRLAVCGAPAVALPLVDPRENAVAQVLAVGVNVHETGALECFQRRDCGHQIHAVVRGVSLASLQRLLLIAKGEDGPPSARPRIAGASAIGMDDHMRLTHPSLPYSRTLLTARWKRSLPHYYRRSSH